VWSKDNELYRAIDEYSFEKIVSEKYSKRSARHSKEDIQEEWSNETCLTSNTKGRFREHEDERD